jgi:pyruvate,water dikinase
MTSGAVLVIPYSDVSWVPLFAQAGAIIAESGGILSHSSIVAREYQLPAVVSIANACRLLNNDMIVTVDGFKGEVIVN